MKEGRNKVFRDAGSQHLAMCRRIVEQSLELYTCSATSRDSEMPEYARNGTIPRSYNELATLMSVTGDAPNPNFPVPRGSAAVCLLLQTRRVRTICRTICETCGICSAQKQRTACQVAFHRRELRSAPTDTKSSWKSGYAETMLMLRTVVLSRHHSCDVDWLAVQLQERTRSSTCCREERTGSSATRRWW